MGAFEIILKAFRIRDELVGIIDDAPEPLAVGMFAIMVDIDDQFIAYAFGVSTISDDLGLDHQLVRRE
jgi:hypothetical protein